MSNQVNPVKSDQERRIDDARRAFWLKWLMLTALGWALGWVLASWHYNMAMGLFVGLAQWYALRNIIPQPMRWVIVTTIGWLAATLIIVAGVLIQPGSGLYAGAFTGLIIGLLQWYTLFSFGQKASWWPFASAVAWMFGMIGFLGDMFIGAFVGAITGGALLWIIGDKVLDD